MDQKAASARLDLLTLPSFSSRSISVLASFDPRPKTRKEDLYDREKELEQFSNALPYVSLIVIIGLLRTP